MKVLKWNLGLASEHLKSVNGNVIPVQRFIKDEKDVEHVLKNVKGEFNQSFIKMDIEGGERYALKAFSKFIKDSKPLLAISAYHRWDDLIVLPDLILKANDSYKLFLKPQVVSYRAPYELSFAIFGK